MFRKLSLFFCLICCTFTFLFGDFAPIARGFNLGNTMAIAAPMLPAGDYPIQQAAYSDEDGNYRLMLLNTPAGTPPIFQGDDFQMARLTDDAIAQGTSSYLHVEGDQKVMYVTEDFRIEYVHNVTETVENPQTGQPETIIVRRESNFWTPFAGAIAGQMVANALFAPRYYMPPLYQAGSPLVGYGGYGSTYGQAVTNYQKTNKVAPAAVTNRQKLRTSGNAARTNGSKGGFGRRNNPSAPKSTGSGVGASNLGSRQKSTQSRSNFGRSSQSFGSGRGSGFGSSRSFGGGRRSFGRRR